MLMIISSCLLESCVEPASSSLISLLSKWADFSTAKGVFRPPTFERGAASSAPLPGQPARHPLLYSGCQAGSVVRIATLAESFCLSRVRMNYRSEFAQTDASRHCHADFTNHLARMPRHYSRAQDFIMLFSDVKFHETLFLTVQNSAIHLFELTDVRVHFHAALTGLTFIEPDVGNFRVGIGAPGHRQGTGSLAAKEQGILNHEACRNIGRMGELPIQANIARSINVRIRRLEAIIYEDPFAMVVLYPHGFQVQTFHVRHAARPDQNLVHSKALLLSVRFV